MKNINEMDSHVNQNESSNQVSGKVRRSFRRFIRVAIVLLLLVGGAFFYVRYYFSLVPGENPGHFINGLKKDMYSKPMREFSLWKVFAPRAGERYSPINLSFLWIMPIWQILSCD